MIKKIWIVIIILLGIVVFQSYNIYKNTYSGYIFDYHYNVEKINIDYVVLSYNLLTIKYMIPITNETVLSVFINDVDKKYNISLQYWFNKRNFYPIKMPRDHNFVPLLDYSNEKFGKSIIKNENDYVILVGKDSSILNVTTKKDISLYKVINENELQLVYDFDNTIYNLRENSRKIKENNLFDETINYINDYIDNYSNLYGDCAYDYIYKYADNLYNIGEIDESMIYYNKYLSISSLKPEILLNKAKIYSRIGDYSNTYLMLDSCEMQEDCNINIVDEIRSKIEVSS